MIFFLVNTNQVRCSKLYYYNQWYSFEVCIHLELDICLQVDILSANQECRSLHPKSRHRFRNLKGLITGSFSHHLLPLPHSPIVFFFILGLAFACGISHCTHHKRKNTPKELPAMYADHNMFMANDFKPIVMISRPFWNSSTFTFLDKNVIECQFANQALLISETLCKSL